MGVAGAHSCKSKVSMSKGRSFFWVANVEPSIHVLSFTRNVSFFLGLWEKKKRPGRRGGEMSRVFQNCAAVLQSPNCQLRSRLWESWVSLQSFGGKRRLKRSKAEPVGRT